MRGIGVRQIRLVCGLILFCYLLSHYINHSLGNVSLDAMEYGLWFHVALWHSVIGTLLLYSALAVHGSLRLWALYQRRHFRWKIAEIVQLTLGLSIPALLCTHLIGERLGVTLYGLQRSYAQALYNFWVVRPDLGVLQAMLLLVAWIHGCIGVYFWLRLKRFFQKWRLSCSGWLFCSRCSPCSAFINREGRSSSLRNSPNGVPRSWLRRGFGPLPNAAI